MARYPKAVWKGPIPNHGGPMAGYRLGVVHIMEGTLAGTDTWFHNPGAQVSAHFGIGKDGTVYQWVDTSTVAWAEAAFNDVAISVEHEGVTGDSLTDAQATADVALVAWCHTTHGIPIQRATTPSQDGWIGHGELGVAGGNHPDCPGAPVLAQLPGILATASPSPSPTPRRKMEKLVVASNASPDGTVPAGTQWVISTAGRFQVVAPNNGTWSGLLGMVPEAMSGEFIASIPVIT